MQPRLRRLGNSCGGAGHGSHSGRGRVWRAAGAGQEQQGAGGAAHRAGGRRQRWHGCRAHAGPRHGQAGEATFMHSHT